MHKFIPCFGRNISERMPAWRRDTGALVPMAFSFDAVAERLLIQFNTHCSLVISNTSHSVCTELCDRHHPGTKRAVPLSNPTKRQSLARTNALRSEGTEACSCWLKRLRQKYSSFSVGEILRCWGRRSGKWLKYNQRHFSNQIAGLCMLCNLSGWKKY